MIEKEWYVDWFASKDYLDVYSHRNTEDTEKLIELIISHINLKQDSNVLDAACGAGRHSIELAKKGFKVTGFDLSLTLLDIAKENAERAKVDIDFINSDLREFDSDTNFDLIVNLFTSFGYFNNDEENFRFINNAFRLLNESGYYVLDYLNKSYVENNLVNKSEKNIADKKIIEERNIIDGRVVKNITILKDHGSYEYKESVKLYSYIDILAKFKDIGFREVKTFGDYFGNNFDQKISERCIIIFQKL